MKTPQYFDRWLVIAEVVVLWGLGWGVGLMSEGTSPEVWEGKEEKFLRRLVWMLMVKMECHRKPRRGHRS